VQCPDVYYAATCFSFNQGLSLAIVKILKEGVFQSNTIKFNMIEISTYLTVYVIKSETKITAGK